jgi:hypothetical protein
MSLVFGILSSNPIKAVRRCDSFSNVSENTSSLVCINIGLLALISFYQSVVDFEAYTVSSFNDGPDLPFHNAAVVQSNRDRVADFVFISHNLGIVFATLAALLPTRPSRTASALAGF